mmetsp:Transcript_485/g.1173  ORF Transcript_485/g.1173 Transcript_485/m.1173 type:complete len:190 (+) Transcript_485:537-1106(+)
MVDTRRAGNGRVLTIASPEDFLNFLKKDNQLCVIKFHADWCKSCQKFGAKFQHFASKHSDSKARFAQVEYSQNMQLCKMLGIKKLPHVHIYKGDLGRLAAFTCGPSKFPLLVEPKVQHFLEATDEELRLEKELEDGASLGDSIVEKIYQEYQKQQQQQHQEEMDDSNEKQSVARTTPGNAATTTATAAA